MTATVVLRLVCQSVVFLELVLMHRIYVYVDLSFYFVLLIHILLLCDSGPKYSLCLLINDWGLSAHLIFDHFVSTFSLPWLLLLLVISWKLNLQQHLIIWEAHCTTLNDTNYSLSITFPFTKYFSPKLCIEYQEGCNFMIKADQLKNTQVLRLFA